jgi:hypothetical protein
MQILLCFTEFAEMQLNITDIKRDLVSTGIPYHPYQNYAQFILFPKEVEAGTLNSFLLHSGVSGYLEQPCVVPQGVYLEQHYTTLEWGFI